MGGQSPLAGMNGKSILEAFFKHCVSDLVKHLDAKDGNANDGIKISIWNEFAKDKGLEVLPENDKPMQAQKALEMIYTRISALCTVKPNSSTEELKEARGFFEVIEEWETSAGVKKPTNTDTDKQQPVAGNSPAEENVPVEEQQAKNQTTETQVQTQKDYNSITIPRIRA